MSDVTLEDVRVRREGRLVLDVPALTLRGQRTTAILGPNGSGKTTMLRVIAGLEQAEGTVRGTALAARRRDVAYVFQEAVFLRQSVRRNLELGLHLRGVHKAEIHGRIEQAVRALGVAHLLERRADRLSGGEARRVSLARALCLRAAVVLLDEPLAGLDGQGYTELLEELPRILAAFDATTLLVTHSRDEALRLAQDMVVLIGGTVHAAGANHAVVSDPGTADVATVLGYTVLTAGGRKVAVRPGALRLGAGRAEFSMTVESVVDMLDRTEVVGRIGGTDRRVQIGADSTMPTHGAQLIVSTERVAEVT